MFTSLRRVFTSGTKSFIRSGAVSFATVLIMTVTLMIIGFLIFLSALLTYTLGQIESKVDVSVYFTTSAAEGDILNLKDKLTALAQVQTVSYTSSDQALQQFKERHASDQLTLNALNELGSNPLGGSLAIQAHDPTQYQSIVDYINADTDLTVNGTSIVDHIDYDQNKAVIQRLTDAIHATEQAGLVIVILFAVASTIIALATVRLAIYSSRDEIAVMRLVGASNAYIRGPFIVAGVLAGVISALIALIIFAPATWYVGTHLSDWLGGFNLFSYFIGNFLLVAGILFGSGILLGGFASYLAVRRYLTI
ncbi:MAG: permease-like cell division protein FtsX [Candidatus Pacebacteria bacterium]|nr:permease-like cell division protein FtsX [Candidatus Paceibacterota bacterium]